MGRFAPLPEHASALQQVLLQTDADFRDRYDVGATTFHDVSLKSGAARKDARSQASKKGIAHIDAVTLDDLPTPDKPKHEYSASAGATTNYFEHRLWVPRLRKSAVNEILGSTLVPMAIDFQTRRLTPVHTEPDHLLAFTVTTAHERPPLD